MDSLKEMETYVDDAIAAFLKKLATMNGQIIDMGRWTQLFAFGMFKLLLTMLYQFISRP
jgi:hypothetical protein